LILGALPLPFFISQLHENEKVRAVVNTCDEYIGPIHLYKQYNITQFHIPSMDFTAPTTKEIISAVEFISDHDSKGNTVYLHCKGGKGRSTTVAVCYLMKKYNISAQEALKRIMKQRPQVTRYIWRRKEISEFAVLHNLKTEDPLGKSGTVATVTTTVVTKTKSE